MGVKPRIWNFWHLPAAWFFSEWKGGCVKIISNSLGVIFQNFYAKASLDGPVGAAGGSLAGLAGAAEKK